MKSKIFGFILTFLQIKCKRKYLFYLSLISLVGWLTLVYNPFRPLRADRRESRSECANFRTNVFFVKTHKTASSTVQNIFLRFGLRHSLNFLLPERSNYLGYSRPIEEIDVLQNFTPPDGKFNIFAHHTRYHQSTNRYLYNDTVRLTILRNPPHLFESVFNFFGWDKLYNISFAQLLIRMPREEQLVIRGHLHSIPLYNRMSYDLGLERVQMKNEKDIRDFVNYIDQQFDFVMITEYMEASLVLLADLMGWPLDYVATIPLMKRAEIHQLTPVDELKLSALNRADTMLYDHYLEKFRERILRYGLTKLTEGIKKLRRINEALVNRCVNSTDLRGYGGTVSYKVRDSFNSECEYATKSELSFTNELRQEQTDRLKTIKNVYKLVNASSS